jgi:hypothetical protein
LEKDVGEMFRDYSLNPYLVARWIYVAIRSTACLSRRPKSSDGSRFLNVGVQFPLANLIRIHIAKKEPKLLSHSKKKKLLSHS